MNLNKNSFLKIFIVVLLLNVSLIFNMNYTHADSGFDASYDSGSSWDSGSSDYGSSYDYGSSSSYSGGYSGSSSFDDFHFNGAWFVFISSILVVILNIYMKKNSIKNKTAYLTVTIILLYILGEILYNDEFFFTTLIICYGEFIGVYIPWIIISGLFNKGNNNSRTHFDYFAYKTQYESINNEALAKELFDIYKNIQLSWAKNDIKSVRYLLSDELFNTYQMQIDSMVQMNQRNEMKDIEFKNMCITHDLVTNNSEELTVTMEVTCRDYIVEMKDGKEKVIRGKESYINDYIYSMTFVRNIKKKTTNCPNCGALLDEAQSSICPSCKSVVVHETENWVLTKKKMLEQSRR